MRAGRDQEAIQYGVNFLVPFKTSREEEELLTVCLNSAPVNNFDVPEACTDKRSHMLASRLWYMCVDIRRLHYALLHCSRTVRFHSQSFSVVTLRVMMLMMLTWHRMPAPCWGTSTQPPALSASCCRNNTKCLFPLPPPPSPPGPPPLSARSPRPPAPCGGQSVAHQAKHGRA